MTSLFSRHFHVRNHSKDGMTAEADERETIRRAGVNIGSKYQGRTLQKSETCVMWMEIAAG